MWASVFSLLTLATPVLLANDHDERPPSPALPSTVAPPSRELRGDVIVILGAEGTPEYGAMFTEWAALWESAAQKGSC
ncbi:MAG: hypothetical protein ACK5Q5_20435, partial [Planctomycetaceae bacterium]